MTVLPIKDPTKVIIVEKGRPWDVAIFHLKALLHFEKKIEAGQTACFVLEPF
jgi:hypothetical protein